MKAADVMTRDPLTAKPGERVREAAERMVAAHISALPVVDDTGAVIGLISEADLLHRAELGTGRTRSRLMALVRGDGALAEDYVQAHAVLVGDIMAPEVLTIAPDTDLAEVVRLMEHHRIRRLPVLDGGRLVGIVSRADLMKAMAKAGQWMSALDTAATEALPTGTPAGDVALRQWVLARIAEQPWAPQLGISVIVAHGVVHLCGVILVAEQRNALRVLAEQAPGAVGVKDHLVFIEPLSGAFVEPPDGPPPAGHGDGI